MIEELIAQGAIDDMRFARLFAQDKRTLEQWGTERIRRGLEARGLDQELIEQALGAEVCDDPDATDGKAAHGELDRALALLRRRFPARPRERRDRERALGVLVRKGYEYELALEAIRSHSGSVE